MQNSSKESEFINKINLLYGSKAPKIIPSFYLTKPKSFRINLLQSDNSVIKEIEEEGYNIQKGPLENSFLVISENKKFSESRAVSTNKVYIQELSSQIPALVLNPQENELILDMCASPGSKTSQIAAITHNEAKIYAIEKKRGRYFKMIELVGKQGAKNIIYKNIDANHVSKELSDLVEKFDKVLLDAPCSNEGGINLSLPSSLKFWSRGEAKKISKLQKGLLNNAFRMLKTGGTLVYSTCTLSFEENEGVVEWFLRKNPDAKLKEVKLPVFNTVDGLTEFNGKEYSSELKKTKRILPTEVFNGFFVAKVTKEKS